MDFDNTTRTELSELGEFGLIKHLTQYVELVNESSVKGVGDDAAVIDIWQFTNRYYYRHARRRGAF